MRTMKYLLAGDSNHKARLHELDLIISFLPANVKHRVFVKLESRYGEYFREYCNYFGKPLGLKKAIYGMIHYIIFFSEEINNWLIDVEGFKQWQCKISIYYKYAPYGSKLVVLTYVDDCVFRYTSKEVGKWSVNKIFTYF